LTHDEGGGRPKREFADRGLCLALRKHKQLRRRERAMNDQAGIALRLDGLGNVVMNPVRVECCRRKSE
jgi:hypothetical protein